MQLLVIYISNIHIRGAIQNYVDFFNYFKTVDQPYMKLNIHISECIRKVFTKF